MNQHSLDPSILDDLFHACAWFAFLDQAREQGCWPDMEATRRRAFAYYEKELAAKNNGGRQWPAAIALLQTTPATPKPACTLSADC